MPEKQTQNKGQRKSWRKLHLRLDLGSGDIVCFDPTRDDVGDTTVLPDPLEQIDADVTRFIADGAYDGEPTTAMLVQRFGAPIEIIIPPPKTAVPVANSTQ